jgi:hypothetical protein
MNAKMQKFYVYAYVHMHAIFEFDNRLDNWPKVFYFQNNLKRLKFNKNLKIEAWKK